MKTKKSLIKTGQNYGNFTLKHIKPVKEINVIYRELLHKPSGAQVIHLESDDIENLFSLSFKTFPSSSNGVAHILEHTVLCGSKKYPVKDPFFSMSRRSLNTFMNAMTGSDFTCYPASSNVEKDFFNLLDVYMDAVFQPLLTPLSFLQEGHRLEYTQGNSKKQELCFKGIVFNEMKGAMNSGMSRLWQKIYESLYPDLTYRHNSGGEPLCIPQLSYKQLADFHKKFYHPSQCLFFFYGNIPVQKTLDYLGNSVLATASKQKKIPAIPKQKRFKTPKTTTSTFPSTSKDHTENLLSISFLTCGIKQQLDLLCLQLLSISLMSHDASPLKKELLASKLCSEVFLSIDDEISEVPVSFIFKGVEKKNEKKMEALLLDLINKIATNGIPKSSLDLAMHQMEFSRLEILKDDSPYGLNLFFRTCLLKQHNGDPLKSLSLHSLFKDLRAKLKDKLFIKKMLFKYFLNNTHRVRVAMHPDPKVEQKELKQEQTLLKKIEKQITKERKKQIQKEALDLIKLQDEEEDIEILPKVTLKDVSKEPKSYPLKKAKKNILFRETFTNKVTYATLFFDLPKVQSSKIGWLKMFISFLPELAWGNRTYENHLEFLQKHLGNLYTTTPIHTLDDNPQKPYPLLAIYAKCLDRKLPYLFSILEDFFKHIEFSKERIEDLVKQHYSSLHSSLSRRAMTYASKHSQAACSKVAALSNLYSGLPYYHSVKDIHDNFEERVDELINFFQDTHSYLSKNWSGSAVFTAEKKTLNKIKEANYLKSFKPAALCYQERVSKVSKLPPGNDAYIISSSVAFTTYSFPTITYQHNDSVYLSIIAQLFENLVLHKRIREQGGAYGSGARFNPSSGIFSFYTYRDPHLLNSLKAFEEAISFIESGKFSDQELEEAKLGLLQSWDAPLSPGSEGSFELEVLISNKSLEQRKARRLRLLQADSKDIQKAIKKHIKKAYEKGSLACFASKSFLEEKNKELKKNKRALLNLKDI